MALSRYGHVSIGLIFPASLGAPNQQSNESDLGVLSVECTWVRRLPHLILSPTAVAL